MTKLLNLAIIVTLVLLFYELIVTIPKTIKTMGLIIKLDSVVKLLKALTSTGIGDTLRSKEKIVVKTWPYICVFEKQKNVIRTDGLELNLQQNIVEQVKPKVDKLIKCIYDNASHLFFSNHMLKRCKSIECDAIEIQKLLETQNLRGVI